MSHPLLENPVWAALEDNHRGFAIGGPRVKRYPREVGPFVAVGPTAQGSAAEPLRPSELLDLIDDQEEVFLVGAIPELPPGLSVLYKESVLQMVCSQPIEDAEGISNGQSEIFPEIVPMSEVDVSAMRALTAVAYPRFFRSRTHELGRYLGIWEGNQLASMAGERMASGNYREVSGVCTHPDFRGRGHARRLIARVVNRILEEGNLAYLHVSMENEKAQALYRSLGFVDANVVPMVLVRRAAAA